MPRECALELKATQLHSLVSMEPSTDLDSILDLTKFSTLSRLIGVTAKIVRAVQRLRTLKKREGINPPVDPVEESQRAELLWVKSAQGKFSDLKTLTKQFNLFKDEKGVWRCGGRLANTNTEIPYTVKYPILLLKTHPLTTLIVKQAHERVCHNGVRETLAETRAKYWIPSGRSFTRKIIHKCVICRRFEGLPFKAPQPPPLPECRVKEAPAFSYTGVDFAGPLVIRTFQPSQSNKVWIALFHLLCHQSCSFGYCYRSIHHCIHQMSKEIHC